VALRRLPAAIHRALHPLVRRLRGHPWAVRALFGVELPRGLEVAFDTTTLALRKPLLRRARGASSALEIGVGQAALLALFVARRAGVPVDGVDVSEARVESSRRTVEANGLPVRVWRSDGFAEVRGRYDLVFSNPPYVPTAAGRALELTRRARFDGDQVWDGGPDGTAVLARILRAAPEHLTPGGTLVVGVQRAYLADARLDELAEAAGLRVIERYDGLLGISRVWVLRRVEAPPPEGG